MNTALACATLALAACSAPTPPAADDAATPPAQAATPPAEQSAPSAPEAPPAQPSPPAAAETPAFVGKTWKVVESAGVQVGTTYTFNADGTVVIASAPGNPPGQGKWTYTDGKLTVEEEGVSYPTDILRLDAEHFDVRSHSPGGTLDIKMVPAS